ncbi:MAG: hypothetical protein IPK72_21665 [Candidatus Eisenbacteria bacterium]|nr:hypothetical protein [Candidatus Eisenbacteria bacterium]
MAFDDYRRYATLEQAGQGSLLDAALRRCNAALQAVDRSSRQALANRLAAKQRSEGKRAVTEGDKRRWLLPPLNSETRSRLDEGIDRQAPGWYHWEVPFEPDKEWPPELQHAVSEYRQLWRRKMSLIDDCVGRNAKGQDLFDDPKPVDNIVRVSGPFTVEAVQPPEMSLGDIVDAGRSEDFEGFAGAPDQLESFDADDMPREIRLVDTRGDLEARNAAAYLRKMYELIRDDGVRFPDNKQMVWASERRGSR